jgi:hypothetical protein
MWEAFMKSFMKNFMCCAMLLLAGMLSAQTVDVTGFVMSMAYPDLPIPGALVTLEADLDYSTHTNDNGSFTIPDVADSSFYLLVITGPLCIPSVESVYIIEATANLGIQHLNGEPRPVENLLTSVDLHTVTVSWTYAEQPYAILQGAHILDEEGGTVAATTSPSQTQLSFDVAEEGDHTFQIVAVYQNGEAGGFFFNVRIDPVEFSGFVVSSATPTVGLDGATVVAESDGYTNSGTTVAGFYSFYVTGGGYPYYVTYSKDGYLSTTREIFVNEAPIIVGTPGEPVVLTPGGFEATPSDTGESIDVAWHFDDGVADDSYHLYRLDSGAESLPAEWTNLGVVSTSPYSDNGWLSVAPGSYRWAVVRNFSGGGQSEAFFSNTLLRTIEITLQVSAHTESGMVPCGMTLTMENADGDPDHVYTLDFDAGQNQVQLLCGSYTITTHVPGTTDYAFEAEVDGQTTNMVLTLPEFLLPVTHFLAEELPQGGIRLHWGNPYHIPDYDQCALHGFLVSRDGFPLPDLVADTLMVDYPALGEHFYTVMASYAGGYSSGVSCSITTTGAESATVTTPAWGFSAAPNPFNPETVLSYSLGAPCHVRVEVFNARGQREALLLDDQLPAGPGRVLWRGINDRGQQASSGVYVMRMMAGGKAFVQKTLLLK